MSYKYLLFDLDDTLLDFKAAEDYAFKKLLEEEKISYSYEIFLKYDEINKNLWRKFEKGELSNKEVCKKRFSEFFKLFFKNVDGKKCDEMYREFLTHGDRLFYGVKEILEILSKKYILFIVSNGIAITQYKRLEINGIEKYFSKVFISEEVGYKKPDKEFFLKILDYTKDYDKSKYLIIGDSKNADIFGGFNFGIDTCFVNNKNEFCDFSTYNITNVYDVKKFL